MVHIDFYSFGKIIIDGKTYERDVLVLPDGKIIQRTMPKGTHVICFSELASILKDKPQVIVIGTGKESCAQLEKGVEEKIKKEKIKLLVQITDHAIKTFNKCKEKKAALLHLTC
ncbi:MAG: MTH938/NDUFAF3 family protein [Candidatus Pacearchaeota archaeon]